MSLQINTSNSTPSSVVPSTPKINLMEWGTLDGGAEKYLRLRFNLNTEVKQSGAGCKLAAGSLGRVTKLSNAAKQDVFMTMKLLPLKLVEGVVQFDQDDNPVLDDLSRQACLEYWQPQTVDASLAAWLVKWNAIVSVGARTGMSKEDTQAMFVVTNPDCPEHIQNQLFAGGTAGGEWVRMDIQQWVAKKIYGLDVEDFSMPVSMNLNLPSEGPKGEFNRFRNLIESGGVAGRFCLELYLDKNAMRVASYKNYKGSVGNGTYDTVVSPAGEPVQFLNFDWTWALAAWKVTKTLCPWGGGETLEPKAFSSLHEVRYGQIMDPVEKEIKTLLAKWSVIKGNRWVEKAGLWPKKGENSCALWELTSVQRNLWVKALRRLAPKTVILKSEGFKGLSWEQLISKLLNPDYVPVVVIEETKGVSSITVEEVVEEEVSTISQEEANLRAAFMVSPVLDIPEIEVTEEMEYFDDSQLSFGEEVDEDDFSDFAIRR